MPGFYYVHGELLQALTEKGFSPGDINYDGAYNTFSRISETGKCVSISLPGVATGIFTISKLGNTISMITYVRVSGVTAKVIYEVSEENPNTISLKTEV